MSDDRTRWNARYADGAYAERTHPSRFLEQHVGRIAPGRAADLACGRGRNALFLARCGFNVDALDVSDVGLELAAQAARTESLEINWVCQDLSTDPRLPGRDYALIVVIRFVAPALLATLPAALAPGGWLLVEEHLRWHEPVAGPESDRFRLEPGALKASLTGLEVIEEFEGTVEEPDGSQAALARMVWRKQGTGTLPGSAVDARS